MPADILCCMYMCYADMLCCTTAVVHISVMICCETQNDISDCAIVHNANMLCIVAHYYSIICNSLLVYFCIVLLRSMVKRSVL